MFPSHEDQLKRLAKVQGQIRGIAKMIEDRRYCADILTQLKAAQAALKKVELGVLENHLRHCVTDAAKTGGEEFDRKIEEILRLLSRAV
ncbi:MAG: hypothetical protein A2600_12065 [Candidatus Lambdaproteobacteria bacterium RIFOXYD1_FULL_56_27]|uniref:Transcriptional regulator n=1 Tax=Candidatus Lambdaproteobacteria bacterium RIFOXYD2_FULL_56_26 TaxID=1817773 RepID=A0A1F6GWZ5_9PROT|nr:MAG: hypothetical protein A2426_08930 [Candidatus Lambdaproteobacteria bacterium RIFOXYC1_FULL_56_13]OGH02697.1 MAG: hypothetical protein A2557_11480 [Candidatus Lambdaproteobacteria bacterium RIFOXYD2_FULL_56_26]OGH07982.1 MAG: hypothetical protein A2600_12065 [Candidatus Lambdaproteobacteria bacterium RIFOXYD1_FULL_56_27]